jgi:fructuronate reductase
MVGVETYAARYVAELSACDYLLTQLIYGDERGAVTPKIQGAMRSVLFVDGDTRSLTWRRLMDLARDPRLQFGTINAPEGAYGMNYLGGEEAEPVSAAVKRDLAEGTVTSDAGKWTAFARERFAAGLPFALVSCTNFSGNGHVTGAVLKTLGRAWEAKGFAPAGFVDYLGSPQGFTFPNCMIDRIAVAPDEAAQAVLARLGIRSSLVVTERIRYWVVEDAFPAGRPAFERAEGVIVEESYAEVKKYEDMKLRILNMGHSTFGHLGVLLGYRGAYGVYRASQDAGLVALLRRIIARVFATLDRPKQMDPEAFARDSLLRLQNPNIPDDPMRAALNGSTKLVPRFLDTYAAGIERGLDPARLDDVLLPVAAFLRYCIGIDDAGMVFELADDPLRETLLSCGARARLGEPESAAAFDPLIARPDVMGRDLFAFGDAGSRLRKMAAEMLEGPGAVRATLERHLSGR